ncbi:anaerobic ribonucleoside-triphosphate reductase activating protein [Candidatus Bathyarchaeota archaeon]|nr:anaerobic ribonucleoside-triphosphate reductase activating protein [Candidatus Bathyarchaeota archaeon]
MIEEDCKLRIGGITDMSTIDWYGNVSLVVFFAGCNFRCPYCQNSSLIPLESGEVVDLSLLEERIDSNKKLIEAIVFTGGEPLLQLDSLLCAIKLSKDKGLKIMLDTNGSIQGSLENILSTGLIDRVALDVKAPLKKELMGKVTGRPEFAVKTISSINKCLNLCKELNISLEARTTIAPGLSDDPTFIGDIAETLKDRCSVYYLQQYDNQGDILDKTLKVKLPPSKETMLKLAKIAIEKGLKNVYIKTRSDGLEKVD